MMKTAISFYLHSRNCYQVLRECLHLPHPNKFKSYFRTLNTPGSVIDSRNTIATVFSKLSGKGKYCKVLVDEIYVKPAVKYQGSHVIGFSHDKPTNAAKTVLAIIIAPMMGTPCICLSTLIPVYSHKNNLFLRQTQKFITLIHQKGGYTFLLIADNLRANQADFNLFKEILGSTDNFSCKHPVENEEIENLYLLYHPIHHLRNIYKN